MSATILKAWSPLYKRLYDRFLCKFSRTP